MRKLPAGEDGQFCRSSARCEANNTVQLGRSR